MASGSAPIFEISADYQSLIRYLPRYRRVAFDPSNLRSLPLSASAQAAVLRSDIADFTVLTDRMVKGGIAGAEQLADVMNKIINRMAEIAWAHGGDLVNWEGDAGTFVWFARDGLSLEDATILAAQTAAAIHREAETWPVDGAAVRFRSAIACGGITHYEIGGNDDEWHPALAGETLLDVIAAERVASPGEIMLSRAALELVGDRCRTLAGEEYARVLAVVDPAGLPGTPPPSGDVSETILRKFAPRIVLAEPRPSAWPGEFRVVTAAYVRLRHPEYASSEDTLATLQDAAQRVQKCLARYEGQLYEIVAESDGVTFIAVFGLPPWSHEDDAARAVKSALALHREWGALGLTSSTGIATGRIFCGTFRTTTDRTVLALVGPIMNLAARLMQLNAGVVCDEETRHAGRQSSRIRARQMTPRMVKGKSDPVTAFAAYDVGGFAWPRRGADESAIGRERELSVLTDCLAKARAGVGGVIVIEGDPGIGKSTLVNRAVAEASETGMIVLAGGGDSTDQTTSYLAWRPVFLDLLARSDLTLQAAATRPSSLGSAAEDTAGSPAIALGAFAHLTPLLEEMLGLQAVDTGETALLRGQARADALARLLKDLLREAASAAPLLVVVEDIHWLDPTSLKLFVDLAASKPPLLLIGATRGSDANPAVQRSLADVEDLHWLRPEPLTAVETGSLLARALGARQADDDLAAMIRDRTGGNPLFVEELSRMAFANRLLFIDGVVQARSSVAAAKGQLDDILERQGLPTTIEGVIRRRLDGLSREDVSVLRAASVVGQSFDRDLCAVGAPGLTPAEIERSLAALIGLGVIDHSDRTPDDFVFRHEVLRDAVYNAMSFAERRQLHDAIGSWIERQPRTEDVSTLLARHFHQAQRHEKAVRYLIAAGETAVRRYANAEAAELLTRAHELAQKPPDSDSDVGVSQAERAHLSLLHGRALLGLSIYADCRTYNEAGLKLAGFPAPPSSFGVALGIVGQTVKLVRHRFWPVRREMGDPEKARLREVVLGYEALAETYYFSGDTLRTLHAAMSTLNLSERLGLSAELARGCATLSGITGFFRMRKASAHYSNRALRILADLEDPAAETWVFTLLGLSKLGEGEWEHASGFLANVVTAATRNGDRRRWRDGVENLAVIEACRGRWKEALVGLTAMFDSAKDDKDRRYMLMASRELAYCRLQLGDLDAVYESLSWLKGELGRDLGTEELPTRLDFHAFGATIAIERRDFVEATKEADAGMKAIVGILDKSSVVNTHLSMFLVARAFANLRVEAMRQGRGDHSFLKDMGAACHALSIQARSFPIAAPAADIARGYFAYFRGRSPTATRCWLRAAASADRLRLSYEAHLVGRALGVAERFSDEPGLPFLVDEGAFGG
jgi:class 3 adenylate cyclase